MSEQKQLSGPEGLEKIGEIIQDIRIAMLTTVAEDGSLDSRPMATQQPQAFDGRIWLLTRDESGKVAQIKQNSHVSLLYAENGRSTYLAVKGLANVSHDRVKIQVLWNAMYKAWFPEGQDDPSIAVLTVDVTEAQYWEASSSSIVRGLKYLAAAATGGQVDIGETGKIQVAPQGSIPVGQPTTTNSGNIAVEERTRELV